MPNWKDIPAGCASVEQFFGWINERHGIYLRKTAGVPAPWTDDRIFQRYKFTNAFRELDRGTQALHVMVQRHTLEDGPARFLAAEDCDRDDLGDLVWNIWWYRLFNLDVHANHFSGRGSSPSGPDELYEYLRDQWKQGNKIFTSAHMTSGRPFEDKIDTYRSAVDEAWKHRLEIVDCCMSTRSMQAVYDELRLHYLIGGFVGYEIVCDLRFTPLLQDAHDVYTWANMGPGAQRGLRRIGLPHRNQQDGLESMRHLFSLAADHLDRRVLYHLPMEHKRNATGGTDAVGFYRGGPTDADLLVYGRYPPFELREIEHSLCEFDKYMRVLLGEGTLRQKYHGGTA